MNFRAIGYAMALYASWYCGMYRFNQVGVSKEGYLEIAIKDLAAEGITE